jgi:hypothetical protein
MNENTIITIPYTKTVNPLGKVVVEYMPDKTKKVKAYLLAEHIRKGVQTGIAFEASKSMKEAYGYRNGLGGLISGQNAPNLLSLVAQKTGSYLARKVDDDGNTTLLYWATDQQGDGIEMIGDLSAYEIEKFDFSGPKSFGEAVKLVPAIRYFVDRFAGANWGMYVFFTQGKIDDLEEVKCYSTQLAKEIATAKRNPVKFVLMGIGSKVNISTLQALDDLDTGTDVDLWDYRIAEDLKDVLEIFAELGDTHTIVASKGKVIGANGHMIADYSASGVPSLMMFSLPSDAKSFELELGDTKIVQPIT